MKINMKRAIILSFASILIMLDGCGQVAKRDILVTASADAAIVSVSAGNNALPISTGLNGAIPVLKTLDERREKESGASLVAEPSIIKGKEVAKAEIIPEAGGKLSYNGVELEIPAGALKEKTEIGIEELSEVESLESGMKNVTGVSPGFRFKPDGMKFLKAVTLRMPYKLEEVTCANEYENLYTYYYNPENDKWEKLYRIGVDEKAQVVESLTDHFTDMINSTLTLPESPKTLNFNPTSVKDIKGGDPGAGIRLIQPPEGNSQGSAALKLDLEVPAGRKGMMPRVTVSYNSEGGNGWLGTGWSLSFSSICVDTRWGVPRYDANKESETYMFDGEMLAPVAHRGVQVDRDRNDREFWPRVEGAFRKIMRYGSNPLEYWWEVTDKNGTKRYYGGTPEEGLEENAVRKGEKGISRWELAEERDVHGNYVRYSYVRVTDSGTGNGSGASLGTQVYPGEITWTGNRGEGIAPAFSVEFVRDRERGADWKRRGDASIDGRGGFKVVTADLLERVNVYEGSRLLRAYGFEYAPGTFGKNLLSALVQYGSDGIEFYRQKLSYYDEVSGGNGYNGFGEAQSVVAADNLSGINIPGILSTEKTMLGTNTGTNLGVNGYVGINWAAGPTKSNSAGIKAGGNWSWSDGQTALMDINGNGVPDKVFLKNNTLYFRAGAVGADGSLSFDNPAAVEGIAELGRDKTSSFTIGGEVYLGHAYVGATYTDTTTEGEVYWTDANGDGLPDLVKNGSVYFCYPDKGTVKFSPDSRLTGVPISPGTTPQMSRELSDLIEAQYNKKVEASPLMDAVRVWEAPYSGKVRITSSVRLEDVLTIQKNGKPIRRDEYTGKDGVRVSIQYNRYVMDAWGKTRKVPFVCWSENIYADDFSVKNFESGEIDIRQGDRIFFRVNSKPDGPVASDGLFDEVSWDPAIRYTEVSGVPFGTQDGLKDANNLDVYRYAASDDFAFAGRSGEFYPGMDTDVTVGGTFRKEITSDGIRVVVKKVTVTFNEDTNKAEKVMQQIAERILRWDETVSGDIFSDLGPIRLKSDNGLLIEGLIFEVACDSPIDVHKIEWLPTIFLPGYYYAKGENGQPETKKELLDENGSPDTKTIAGYCSIPVYRPVLNRSAAWVADKQPWVETPNPPEVPEADSTVTIWASAYIPGSPPPATTNPPPPPRIGGKVIFTVKRADEVGFVAKKEITLSGNTYNGAAAGISLVLENVQQGEKYFLEFHFTDPVLRGMTACSVDYRYGSEPAKKLGDPDKNGIRQMVDCFHPTDAINIFELTTETFLPALYRGWGAFAYNASGERGTQPINENDLVIDDNYAGNINHDTGAGAREPNAYIMYPGLDSEKPDESRWKSEDDECWIAGRLMSSSRKGDDHPEKMTLSIGAGSGIRMLNRKSWAPQGGISGGAGFGIPGGISLGASVSVGDSYTVVDYMDFNGDRYPDFINEYSIQYTDYSGGLSSENRPVGYKRTNHTVSGSINAGPDKTISEPSSNNGKQKLSSQMSPGGNIGGGTSDCFHDYIDMNGDGLPDVVSVSSGKISVQLNTGYGFGAGEDWGTGTINKTLSWEAGAPINLGFNIDKFSFGGGLSGSVNSSGVNAMLFDINGDGLPDYVIKSSEAGALTVWFNTGSGFADKSVTWNGGFMKNINTVTENYGASGGGCAYATIAIGPIFTFTIIINIGGSLGTNISRQVVGLRDVNADGCPDYVWSENDGDLRVKYNQTGRTNLLRRVDEPLGGSIELEYARSKPTQDMPQGKWLLSGVKVNDGHAGDGIDTQYTTYTYDLGKYDRYERESYGYGMVTAERKSPDGRTLCSVESHYNTTGYFQKGLLDEQDVYDEHHDLLSLSINRYTPVKVRGDDANIGEFPALTQTESREYEPGSRGELIQVSRFTYDGYGNVIECIDEHDPSVWEDDVTVSIDYGYNEQKHILNLPSHMIVEDYAKHTLRERRGTYDEYGEMTGLDAYNGAARLSSTLTYDDGTGNVLSVTDPTGYQLSYEYDDATGIYVTEVRDSFGYVSRSVYDTGLGVPLENTDMNGNKMKYEYDPYGRLEAAFGPYDTTHPALSFEYFHREVPARAVTRNKVHFDPSNTEEIVTVVIVDGLGRVIQTKKQADVWDRQARTSRASMSISGLVTYDALGRAVEEGQPTYMTGNDYNFTPVDMINPTIKEYDAKNREKKITFADKVSTVNTQYSIVGGRLETLVIDPLGRRKTSYTDIEGNIVEVVQEKGVDRLSTRYTYDPLQEIIEVQDARNNPVKIAYDMLGRKTSMTTPDTGRTDYAYDNKGRLWKQVDDNLRAKGQSIEYQYDYGRLAAVKYPESGNVEYIYGVPGDTNNTASRLKEVRNNMSTVRYEYGKLGEAVKVTKVLKRIAGSNQTYTAQMGYMYDYLGRMERIIYPDGEAVRYAYNRGGEVVSVTGSRDGLVTSYVKDIAYDEFGQRAYIKYGNEVSTEYWYHPARRWLSRIRTQAANGRIFQEMRYTFDHVGNVLETVNTASNRTVTQLYGYDALDELVAAHGTYEDRTVTVAQMVSHDYFQTFEYDPIGNMTRKTSTNSVNPGRSRQDLNYVLDYSYEANRPHCAKVIGDYGYQYDSNGNVTAEIFATAAVTGQRTGSGEFEGTGDTDPNTGHALYTFSDVHPDKPAPGTIVKAYTWDEENRMKEAVIGREHVYFGYDAGGERTVKWSEHGETMYVDRMYQVETTKNPNLYTKHIFVGDTRLVSRIGDEGGKYGGQDAEMYYYHADHIGSSNFVTDTHGAEYEHFEYTPYGETWVDEGRDSLNRITHLFTSKELDSETGLYYYGARYLDPKTSRWMSSDPALGDYLPVAPINDDAKKHNRNLPGMGGVFSPVNMAVYHYAGNNPLKYTDPTGRDDNKREQIIQRILRDVDTSGQFRSQGTFFGRHWRATLIPDTINYLLDILADGDTNASCTNGACHVANHLQDQSIPIFQNPQDLAFSGYLIFYLYPVAQGEPTTIISDPEFVASMLQPGNVMIFEHCNWETREPTNGTWHTTTLLYNDTKNKMLYFLEYHERPGKPREEWVEVWASPYDYPNEFADELFLGAGTIKNN